MEEGRKDTENGLFTLPYRLFILLQNFTRTISSLHTPVEHRGTERQKISISHPKGINNIKETFFSFKTDTFIWNSILLLQKINKSSKEFLIFQRSRPFSGIQFLGLTNISFARHFSLLLTLLSVSCWCSLFPRHSFQSIEKGPSSSPKRSVSLTIASPLPNFLCDISITFSHPVSFPGFPKLYRLQSSLCVWALFRPPVGQAGSALRPGCCWRSTQAFRHSPSLEGQDCPSITQAPPCPCTPAPPQLHREKGRIPGRGETDLVYVSYLQKKEKKKKSNSGEAHCVTVQYADASGFLHTKHQNWSCQESKSSILCMLHLDCTKISKCTFRLL